MNFETVIFYNLLTNFKIMPVHNFLDLVINWNFDFVNCNFDFVNYNFYLVNYLSGSFIILDLIICLLNQNSLNLINLITMVIKIPGWINFIVNYLNSLINLVINLEIVGTNSFAIYLNILIYLVLEIIGEAYFIDNYLVTQINLAN